MNVYLIGMMGSGKTATGKVLAALTGYRFTDLDDVIETREGRTIRAIFETRGEPFFRDLETASLNEASQQDRQIVSTGGGVVLRPENRERMKSGGSVVFLETSLPVLIKRLKGTSDRPLLRTPDWTRRLEELVKERLPLYREAASHTINTDGKTAAQAAEEIAVLLGIRS